MKTLASRLLSWFALRAPTLGSAVALLCVLTGCAQSGGTQASGSASIPRAGYVVRFRASRLKDHTSLAAVSVPLRLGQTTTVHTDLKVVTEDRPALPEFAATLTRTKTPGLYQLVTKIAIREAARNKKGKLKVSKRNQGTLLPIRLGEKQAASPPDDPIQVDVQVDRR